MVAELLGIEPNTLSKAILAGRLRAPARNDTDASALEAPGGELSSQASSKSERSSQDSPAPMGRGASNVKARVAASQGALNAVAPQFQRALDVPFGGVLLALPALLERVVARTEAIAIGDPTGVANWMGPVINAAAVARYRRAASELHDGGLVLTGGRVLTQGALAHGHFVAPTVGAIDAGHRLWREELLLPFVLVGDVDSLGGAIDRANDNDYGLTAGFYGAPDEIARFLGRIEAGVTYVNHPQGATTGA